MAQTKTNLGQMQRLIDKSITKIDSSTQGIKIISVNLAGTSSQEIFKPKILEKFTKLGYALKENAEKGDLKISISILSCNVVYSDLEKDGFLGSTMMNRTVSLDGSVTINYPDNTVKVFSLNESVTDVVFGEDVKNLEDSSFPFTQGQVPQPSFFSNLFEPLLVVGTLISTVILLFTVRGK